ncbi:site-specific integrase [Streptomyces cavernicola]|uniref:Site-specific integrase n=1 Tax=Streptomyces cavernicola TaxID=3043613 RepID=A0ABT6S4Z9_9ACTN|nr:site-specific integrase [Streptomyces sp. B-S-A6]MDI3403176.1 site-specific integrase [Streptomyces sp. B-S-A6]
MTLIAPTLQAFFTDRLARERQVSPRTIAAYRDALRLLLCFVQQRTGTRPEKLDWNDLNAEVISAFLNHLEDERGNSARTRNVRLTAIRSLFSYAALQHPEHILLIRTSCGTVARCPCCRPELIPRSSHSGSATPASGPPTPTSTRT